MEEDIDIEEHDVLDDPKIKSIFPDLSCVKMEIPDEEEVEERQYAMDEEWEQDSKQPDQCQQSSMLYQYEYQFESRDIKAGSHCDENSETYNEDSQEYLYNNQIILGSKPPIDPEVLYQEALNSKPIVYLEDWGYNLQNNPCFCPTCEILFPTVNTLEAHKMIAHSFLIALDVPTKNTARKTTTRSKFCNHCSRTFPDDTSLIKHLYELLPINNYQKTVREVPSVPIKYKCQKCKRLFNSYNAGKYHRTTVHPELKHVNNLIIKLKPKLDKIKNEPKPEAIESVNKKAKQIKCQKGSSVIPLSTLFQCNKCHTNFISCFPAIQHQNQCVKKIDYNQCNVCNKKIRLQDVKTHILQHKYSDKIKIYSINKRTYEKVLCVCPSCDTCFEEILFWSHIKKCTRDTQKEYCNDCKVNITRTRYTKHIQRHKQLNLTKKDFIIVHFKNPDDNITPKNNNKTKKKQKSNPNKDILMYHCENCDCSMHYQTKMHITGDCIRPERQTDKKFCDICGLAAHIKVMKSHLVMHETREFSLKDIKFISLLTSQEIETPVPRMNECHKCHSNFLTRKSLVYHNCADDTTVICHVCHKKFSSDAYNIHLFHHPKEKQNIPTPKKVVATPKMVIPTPKKVILESTIPKTNENGLNELLMKYNSINNMWNVLYRCICCEIISVRYDSVVEHAQHHLTGIGRLNLTKCEICEFDIRSKDYKMHEQLHKNNEQIDTNSFKILSYDYNDLLKGCWLNIFQTLPVDHKEQILMKSIYRYTRHLRFHLRRNSLRDDTKYLCRNCRQFVDPKSVLKHYKSKCRKSLTFDCKLCGAKLKTHTSFLSHSNKHELGKRYKIVSFNFEADRQYDKILCEKLKENGEFNYLNDVSKQVKVDDECKNININENLVEFDENPKEKSSTNKLYKIFKCEKCSCCVNFYHNVSRHRCIPVDHRRLCTICGQFYSSRVKYFHMKTHENRPNFTKDNIKIIPFNLTSKKKDNDVCILKSKKNNMPKVKATKIIKPKFKPNKLDDNTDISNKTEDLIAHIFKCDCGLHFTSMKTVETHLDLCNPDLDIAKEKCSKCDLLFPTDLLVTHLCNHHSKTMKMKIEKIKKINLVKCTKCLLLFQNSELFYRHSNICDTKYGVKCSDCNLIFHKTSYEDHRCSVKDKTTYINKIINKTINIETVHTCKQCDLNFMCYRTCTEHINSNHKTKLAPVNCDICNLKFTKISLFKHKEIHTVGEEYRIRIYDRITDTNEIITGKNYLGNAKKRKIDLEISDEKKIKIECDNTVKVNTSSERSSKRLSLNKNRVTDMDSSIDKSQTDILEESESDNNLTICKAIKLSIDNNIQNYTVNLYKCIYCEQHFMFQKSLDYHLKTFMNHAYSKENYKCDLCGLDFSRNTLPRHKYAQHVKLKLKREDFVVLTETQFTQDSNIYNKIQAQIDKMKTSDIDRNSVVILNESIDKISDVNKNSDSISYFKCAFCNVCFLSHISCYNHCLDHKVLDPKLYIHCKICEFQFMIDSLKDHMDLHHSNDFKIQNLTIEEYRPQEGTDPKIDSYQAIDKVQSRLVSTTTDVLSTGVV